MKTIHLGDGKTYPVAFEKLLDTRTLIHGSSGSGKTHLTRRLLEETHGLVQQIVLDPEGEYSPLREKFGYVLAAKKGGDVVADPKSAGLLALKLLEIGASCIVDLYELQLHEQQLFVRNFLDAMMNSPKHLHHPVLVVIDEADIFVPEKSEPICRKAVIDLARRGRKRGFCATLVTQRISMVSKDATAQLQNRLIGLTTQDNDQKRAADELGFGKDAQRELRNLELGEFWAFGPAISRDVIKARIGKVLTPEPKAGEAYKLRAPKPSADTLAAIKKLVDLPQAAAEEARTVEELRHELELARRHRCPKAGADPAELERQVASRVKMHVVAFKSVENGYKGVINRLEQRIVRVSDVIKRAAELVAELPPVNVDTGIAYAPEKIGPYVVHDASELDRDPAWQAALKERGNKRASGDDPLGNGGTYRIAVALMSRPEGLDRAQLGIWSHMNPGGGFRNCLSDLRELGFLIEEGGLVKASGALRAHLHSRIVPVLEAAGVAADWRTKFGGGALRIYDHLLSTRPEKIGRDELARAAGMEPGGGFRNCLSELRRAGLISEGKGWVSFTDNLFL